MQNMSGGKTALGLDANVGAMLTYLPVCGISLIYSIIVLVTDKDNKTVRFHAFQSLLLMAACFVVVFAIVLVGGVLVGITGSGILGTLVFLLYCGVGLLFLIAAIMGCIKAFGGQPFKLPVIGDMAEKWANG
jgi:uncharacterized membrane protein